MITREIHASTGSSRILVGERLENLGRYVPAGQRLVIVTDATIRRLYGDRFPEAPVIEIGQGEASKTLDTLAHIYDALVEAEADRSTFLVAVGGGLVCDVTGFAASTYLRGVSFGFAATTLLAQVDASVGGKNGVNFKGYKNMVGVFHQPEFVICDTAALATLSRRGLLCGFAEIVKHAAIADADLFRFLEERWRAALDLDADVIGRLVDDSVVIKAGVVQRDEKEAGERRKLNFGHTFGHAVEKNAGIPHGEAVSVGMVVAADLSVRRGLLTREEAGRIKTLLANLGLPTTIDMPAAPLVDALRRDKKRGGDAVHFVLLQGLGRAVVEPIPLSELEAVAHDLHRA